MEASISDIDRKGTNSGKNLTQRRPVIVRIETNKNNHGKKCLRLASFLGVLPTRPGKFHHPMTRLASPNNSSNYERSAHKRESLQMTSPENNMYQSLEKKLHIIMASPVDPASSQGPHP